MPKGAGKYDDLATDCLQKSQAKLVLVAVVDGNAGSGFSVQTTDWTTFATLVVLLRETADQIEKELNE
jgi:hypothetical protein